MKANLYALAAIGLWASLAALGVALKHVPPFLLTGIALCSGSVLAWPYVLKKPQLWRGRPSTLRWGVCTLFAYHSFLLRGLLWAPRFE